MTMTFHVQTAEPIGYTERYGEPYYGPEPGAPECNMSNANAAIFLRDLGYHTIMEESCGTFTQEDTHTWLRYLIATLNTDAIDQAAAPMEIFYKGQVEVFPPNRETNTLRVQALMAVFNYAAQHNLQVYVT